MTKRPVLLSFETTSALRALAIEEGVAYGVAVAAGWVALLGRYATREDVMTTVEEEGAARVIRATLVGDPDGRALVRRVDASLERTLAEEGERTSHTVPGAGEGVVTKLVFGEPGATRADLALVVAGEDVRLEYDPARVCDASAGRVVEHLRALLEGVSTGGRAVAEVPIVVGEERAFVLACANVAGVDFEEELPGVVELFEAHVRRAPEATALIEGSLELTYRALDDAANVLAARLRAIGAAGKHVAVYLERGADAVIAFLGILKARAVYVPIDTSYPEGRVRSILESADPLVVVTRRALARSLPGPARAICLVDAAGEADAGEHDLPAPSDVAYIIFTSGSTGRPKGVVVDHRALANYARAAIEAYGCGSTDRILQGASLGFDLSLEEFVVTLCSGAALYIRTKPIESVQGFVGECIEQRLTVISITSALWHELAMRLDDGSARVPPRLRLVILGADAARADVLPAWARATRGRVRLINSYGLTETAIVATLWEAGTEPLEGAWRALPIGRPMRNITSYVLDPKGQLSPVGVPGEVCVGGLAVGRRYLGDDELTRARFVPDPVLAGRVMYRTGDRGMLRPGGELEFLGRADHQVKVNGVRIELAEIETRIREIAGVIEGVVVARKNGAGETELEAYVMASSPDLTPAVVREQLVRAVPLATVPARVRMINRFPLTPAGKVDRRALAASSRDEGIAGEVVAPATPLEELVTATVAGVLGVTRVGVLDSFAALGGTSLLAVRAASLLAHKLGRRVRAQLFFEARTLREACVELTGTAQSIPPSARLDLDTHLDPRVTPATARAASGLKRVLLTGATGFFGAFVLADLLRETDAHVVCLVRAPSADEGLARVHASLAARHCAVDPYAFAARVSVALGDLALPTLGLDAATFGRLSETTDAVVHAGANVNMILPYEALRVSNVLAVASVLELASTGRPKTVHHVSTVEVLFDTDPADPRALAERPVGPSPARLYDGYAQSKWAAEKLVDEARARGLRAYTHRPGRLMGHSRTGAFNPNDLLVSLLEACGEIGLAPQLDVRVDVTPVDYASRALVLLALREPAADHPFHLVHPEPVPWSVLLRTIISLGYPLRTVPHAAWCAQLERHAAARGRADFLYLAAMSRDEAEHAIAGGYGSEATRAMLGTDVPCPPVDDRLVSTYLRALTAEGRFPPPVRSLPPPRPRHELSSEPTQ